jgi:general secretion pathway protein J
LYKTNPGIVHKKRIPFEKEFSEKGMTLIEIMVAIFIFGIAVTTIFVSFQTVIGHVDIISRKTAAYEMGKTCLNQIISDLCALHPSLLPMYKAPDITDEPDRNRVVGDLTSLDGGDFSNLRFTAKAHLPMEGSPRTGVSQIVYYPRQTRTGDTVLCRSDMPYPYGDVEENEKDPVLCKNVRGFRLVYFDAEGAEFERWDSDSDEFGYATPRAIRITLTIGAETEELILGTTVLLPVFREKKEP